MTHDAPQRFRDLSPRAMEIVTAARTLLEDQGLESLSMRRVAAQLGIQAPALYRHFPDKRELELIIIEQGLWESGDRLLDAIADADDRLEALMGAARAWALEHPHVYRLSYGGRLDRSRVDPEAEQHAGEAVRAVTANNPVVSRAIWAFAHGMIDLEILNRFPPGSDIDGIWRVGADPLQRANAFAKCDAFCLPQPPNRR